MLFPYSVTRVRSTVDDCRLAIRHFPTGVMPTYTTETGAIRYGVRDLMRVMAEMIKNGQSIPLQPHQEAFTGQALQVSTLVGIKIQLWNHSLERLPPTTARLHVTLRDLFDLYHDTPIEALDEALLSIGMRLVSTAVDFTPVQRKPKVPKRKVTRNIQLPRGYT